jgi:hypothetical protein
MIKDETIMDTAQKTKLEEEFEKALLGLCEEINRKFNQQPTRLLQMIKKDGALKTATDIINAKKRSGAYIKFRTKDIELLEYSIEAFVLRNNQFYSLFEKTVLTRAEDRLKYDKYSINYS